MPVKEKKLFDGFYIPMIPDADYFSDTDIHGCNFLFIDDRKKRFLFSFESGLDCFERCRDDPKFRKYSHTKGERSLHVILCVREDNDPLNSYGFFVWDTPFGRLEGQVSLPQMRDWDGCVFPALLALMDGLEQCESIEHEFGKEPGNE